MSKTLICPHCGSKETKEENGWYHCSACHRDFGRTPFSDDGTEMVKAVTGLRFRYGDIFAGSVRLRFVSDGEGCVYEVYDANEGGVDKVAGVLDDKAWKKFKENLFEKLFVMDWDKEYVPVNDGREIRGNNEWELAVEVGESEEYVYHGVDAYPVYWNRFMKLLDPFFDQLKQQ